MKYRVAIVDSDIIYLSRISKVFGNKYADKLSVSSYSSMDILLNDKERNRYDIVLVEEGLLSAEDIPDKMNIVYLISENDIEKVDGVMAICKFQRHEIIMRQILNICLENESTRYTKKNAIGNITKVILVTASTGGIGTTTIAIALSKYLVANNKKTLYLSFENNPATELFFQASEDTSMSDIIYMVKSKKNNIVSRIENIIQRDSSGVFFIPSCRVLFDISELKIDEMIPLLQEICSMGNYDNIVIDGLLSYSEAGFKICDFADDILVVSSRTNVASKKTSQMIKAMNIWDDEKNAKIRSKSSVIFNQCKEGINTEYNESDYKVIGCISKYSADSEIQICDNISQMTLFGQLL